jgi:single-strand DNA-binding protein
MNDTYVTLVGNAVTDVVQATTKSGIENATFRMASTSRRYDKGISAWVDGDTSYVRVIGWRRMARHIAESIRKGEPVLVHGVLKVREWEDQDGRRRTSVEVEAHALGHDISRGVSAFTRPPKRDVVEPVDEPGAEQADAADAGPGALATAEAA